MALAELLHGFNTAGIGLDFLEAGLVMVQWKFLLQMLQTRPAWHDLVDLVVLLESIVQDVIFAPMTFDPDNSMDIRCQ